MACLVATAACRNDATGLDLDGNVVAPLSQQSGPVLLAFVSSECPISNQYAPELQRISQAFAPRGLRSWLVYPSRLDDGGKIRAHRAAFDFGMPALRDPEHALVQRAGVQVTPSVAVFDRNGALAYSGRIDDRHVALGVARARATRADLVLALGALLAGQPIDPSRTQAVGCSIAR